MKPRGWYSNKFYNLYPFYPRDASNQDGNDWPCSFQEKNKNVKLLSRDNLRTTDRDQMQ